MPHWEYTIDLGDVFHNDALSYKKKRDAIVDRLRASRWLREAGPGSTIVLLVDQLALAGSVERFDRIWNNVYDEANIDRAWIETHA